MFSTETKGHEFRLNITRAPVKNKNHCLMNILDTEVTDVVQKIAWHNFMPTPLNPFLTTTNEFKKLNHYLIGFPCLPLYCEMQSATSTRYTMGLNCILLPESKLMVYPALHVFKSPLHPFNLQINPD